jgi:hypothetical protein
MPASRNHSTAAAAHTLLEDADARGDNERANQPVSKVCFSPRPGALAPRQGQWPASAEQIAQGAEDVGVERAVDVAEQFEWRTGAAEERAQGPGELGSDESE